MKSMYVDFSGHANMPGLAPRSAREVLFWGVLLLAIIAALGGLVMLSQVSAQTKAIENQIAEIESDQVMAIAPEPEADMPPDVIAGINSAVTHLNYPWSEIFSALEKSSHPDVAIVTLEVGLARQTAKITVDAPGANEVLTYIEQLRGQPNVGVVSLTRQELVTTDNNTQMMRFTLDVQQTGAATIAAGTPGAAQ